LNDGPNSGLHYNRRVLEPLTHEWHRELNTNSWK